MNKTFSAAVATLVLTVTAVQADLITLPNDRIRGVQLLNDIFVVATEGTEGGQNQFPGGERPALAIDGNAGSKYLNFAEFFTGYFILPDYGSSIVQSIELVTANDEESRDPSSYALYGSNSVTDLITPSYNLTEFSLISSGSLSLPTARQTAAAPVAISNAAAYTSYILVFPTVRDSGAANSMQISEARLIGVPEPTSALLLASGLGLLGMVRRRTV